MESQIARALSLAEEVLRSLSNQEREEGRQERTGSLIERLNQIKSAVRDLLY
jgi:hypothetical protein